LHSGAAELTLEEAMRMWYVKNLFDRAQVAFLLWRLRRHRLLFHKIK
jgi:hypothetical protein